MIINELKATTLAWNALRLIQNLDTFFQTNRNVVKVADALHRGLRRSTIAEHAFRLEHAISKEVINAHDAMYEIDPVSYIVFLLEDQRDTMKPYFKINYKLVAKIGNLSADKAITTIHINNADKLLNKFMISFNKKVYDIKKIVEEKQNG